MWSYPVAIFLDAKKEEVMTFIVYHILAAYLLYDGQITPALVCCVIAWLSAIHQTLKEKC